MAFLYEEGIDNIPDINETVNAENASADPSIKDTSSYAETLRQRRFLHTLPSVVYNEDMLSGTSKAEDCFIYRKNSRRLQTFLVSYVLILAKSYNVTVEF